MFASTRAAATRPNVFADMPEAKGTTAKASRPPRTVYSAPA